MIQKESVLLVVARSIPYPDLTDQSITSSIHIERLSFEKLTAWLDQIHMKKIRSNRIGWQRY